MKLKIKIDHIDIAQTDLDLAIDINILNTTCILRWWWLYVLRNTLAKFWSSIHEKLK